MDIDMAAPSLLLRRIGIKRSKNLKPRIPVVEHKGVADRWSRFWAHPLYLAPLNLAEMPPVLSGNWRMSVWSSFEAKEAYGAL
jgi:hypothetical protein